MFERYTETARKVIFFARYEASQFGSSCIETEHLLLGLLREDRSLALRLLKSQEKVHAIRKQLEKGQTRREKISTSVDLPLSHECKRVLAFGAEEAQRLKHDQITPDHLVLGLLHEPESLAAKTLLENGITVSVVEEAFEVPATAGTSAAPPVVSPLPEGCRDLTAEAMEGTLSPLIGREGELDRIIQILSRRTRNNAVLIGDAGVGKNAVINGLARRIAEGAVPRNLADRTVAAIDAGSLLSSRQGEKLTAIRNRGHAILYVQGLFDLAAKGAGWGVLEAIRVLEPYMSPGGLQCVATGTPAGYRLTLERAETLVRFFEVVPVLEPNEEEAVRIVKGVKEQYEKFHSVVFTDEAIETAVSASRWFLRNRNLPDRAIDLIDDAGARVKLRVESEPREVFEVRKRLKAVTREMENAIANHEFQKARHYSDLERKERQSLQELLDRTKPDSRSSVVQPEDVVETVATRAKVSVAAVTNILQLKNPEQMDLVAKELAAQIPMGGREWAEDLTTYLAGCSAEDAEEVAQAIRRAKSRLDSQQSGNKMGSGA